ncbi:MAG: 3-dehydroquinate synthase [Monoraphidium minutum]|nr:MAG: 3-dehydroquinate synthase [Monoraphidium minutum]
MGGYLSQQQLWIETRSQAVLTAAVESGHDTFVFGPGAEPSVIDKWQAITRFTPLRAAADGAITGASGEQVGRLVRVVSREDLDAAEALAGSIGYVVMDCDAAGWKVIPAENLVAAFQAGPAQLMAAATTAADARVMLEALEVGTAGVLLRTDDPAEVRELAAYLRVRAAQGAPSLALSEATVSRVAPVGMADRVCVDLASMLSPGEGMLVGSFSRALFLVHSECMESAYINSRPFRVNAGAVTVCDAAGRARAAVVGRCKVEARPMLLVEARDAAGRVASTLLQNAETVRLVGPAAAGGGGGGGGGGAWRAIPVSQLAAGDKVYLLQQEGARHTGIAIQERISEL